MADRFIDFFDGFGMYLGIAALVAWMCYIMYKLARESKAGRFGTIMIFVVLGMGILGFILKGVIQWFLEGKLT